MNLKFKNFTLLTLLITALPFATFTPLWASDADALSEGIEIPDVEDSGMQSDLESIAKELDDGDVSVDKINESLQELSQYSPEQVKQLVEQARQVAQQGNLTIENLNSAMKDMPKPQAVASDTTLADDATGVDVDTDLLASQNSDLTPDDTLTPDERIQRYKELKGKKAGLEDQLEKNPDDEDLQTELANVNTELENVTNSMLRSSTDAENAALGKGKGIVTKVQEAGDSIVKWYNDQFEGSGSAKLDKENAIKRQALGKKEAELANMRARGASPEEINEQEQVLASMKERGASSEEINAQETKLANMRKPAASEEAIRAKEEEITKMRRSIRDNATIGRKLKRAALVTVKWVGEKTWGLAKAFAMLIGQALAFTIPSALYQMTVAAEAKKAMLETIASAQPFGHLWLQIPPQLIDNNNPTGSSYLYCEVPNGNTQPASYFNSHVLSTSNFYVASAPQPQFWGTAYIGGAEFDGTMICLNNGWVFAGNGQSTQPMVPMISKSGQDIESFASSFVNTSNATTYSHSPSLGDWLAMDSSKLMAKPSGHTFNDPYIKALLLAPTLANATQITDALPGSKGMTPPPPIFASTIAQFRSPTPLSSFAGLQLKQMEGTGFLNVVLDNSIDTSDPALKTALVALLDADDAYQSSVTINTSTRTISYGEAELQTLQTAQNNVATALKNQNSNINTTAYGFSPAANINAHTIYVYEIVADNFASGTMTPSLHALLRNTANSSYMPLKEYVVCLNKEGEIIPLLIPEEIQGSVANSLTQSTSSTTPSSTTSTSGTSSGTTTSSTTSSGTTAPSTSAPSSYTVTMQTNPNIVYISSLTTGMTYEMGQETQTVTNSKGVPQTAAQLLKPLTNSDGSVNFSMATQAMSNLQQNLPNSDLASEIMQQITTMANYTTDNVINGPFTSYSGYTFKKVPLADLLKSTPLESTQSEINAISGILNLTTAAEQQSVTVSSSTQASVAPQIYIYQVSTSTGAGALGADAKGPLYDYVVPIGGAVDGGTFQILPLGTDQITGGIADNAVEVLFSLVTGQGKDPNYDDLPLWYTVTMKPVNRGSYYGLTGTDKFGYQGSANVDNSTQTVTTSTGSITFKTVHNVYMGTAYMPTHFNPANRVILPTPFSTNVYNQFQSSLSALSNPALPTSSLTWQTVYEAVKTNVINLGQSLEKNLGTGLQGLSNVTQGLSEAAINYGAQALTQSGGSATLLQDGFSQADITAIQNNTAATQLQAALNTYTQLNTIINTNMYQGQSFNPPLTTWPTSSMVLYVQPLYFLSFTNFSYCASGGATAVQAQGGSGSSSASSPNWVTIQACQSPTPLPSPSGKGNGALINVLPEAFSGFNFKDKTFYQSASVNGKSYDSILDTYRRWVQTEEKSNYWVASGLMGPFNFTQRLINDVYITATSLADVKNGNFFYTASGFTPSDLFVYATGPADITTVTADTQFTNIGAPYANLVEGNYLINIATGQVYAPYVPTGGTSLNSSSTAPYACFSGTLNDYQCSLQPVGQNVFAGGTSANVPTTVPNPVRTGRQVRLNPQKVLAAALATQNAGKITNLSPSLQSSIANAMQNASQQIKQSLYPVYFDRFTLSLSQTSLDNGSYIYAVISDSITPIINSSAPTLSSLGASTQPISDYLVVASQDSQGNIILGGQPVTPYVQGMLSLVTGILYQPNNQKTFNYLLSQGYPSASLRNFSEQAMNLIVSSNNNNVKVDQALAKTINDLHLAYLVQANSIQAGGALLNSAPLLSLQALSQGSIVTEPTVNDPSVPDSNLVQIGSKYYLQMKSALSQPIVPGKTMNLYTYFDFNATNNATDGGLGIYYQYPTQKNITNLIPTAAVTGFELDAMRATYGVTVGPDGTQSVTVPATRLPIPCGPKQTYLIPMTSEGPSYGQSGYYMKAAPSYIPPYVDAVLGLTYYYYVHQLTQAYYALVVDTGGIQDSNGQTYARPSYFVDLLSGDKYDLRGNPVLTETKVAYPLANGAINIEQPMFIWGTLNNTGTDSNLNVLANTGEGYTQYLYIPFSIQYVFVGADKTQIIVQYSTSGQGASATTTVVSTVNGGKPRIVSLPSEINTDSMTSVQILEATLNAEVQRIAQSQGSELVAIQYQISPSATPEGALTLIQYPTTYGQSEYSFNGVRYATPNSQYQIASNNLMNGLPNALVAGTPFVAYGMGNRQNNTGMPSGTSALGDALCGIMNYAPNGVLLGFVPTVGANYYALASSVNPGQPATYQIVGKPSSSQDIQQIQGMAINYPLIGGQSSSGVAAQGFYLAFNLSNNAQAIYNFDYSYASGLELNLLKSTVNVLTNSAGNMQILPQINMQSASTVSGVPSVSIGSQYLLGFSDPIQTVMYMIPPVSVAQSYFAQNTTQYAIGGNQTMTSMDIFNNMATTFGVGTYINYYNGAIYQKQSNSNYLYPIGFSVGSQALNVIKQQFGNASTTANSLVLTVPINTSQSQVNSTSRTPAKAPGSSSGRQPARAPGSSSTQSTTVGYTFPSQPIGKAFMQLAEQAGSLFGKLLKKIAIV